MNYTDESNSALILFLSVICCRHSLQDLTCEISSMREQLNVFSDNLQRFSAEHLNYLFTDLCLVLILIKQDICSH